MSLQEFIETLEKPDRLRIIKDNTEIYTGYLGMLLLKDKMIYATYRWHRIKHFRAEPEITHKEWEKLGLTQPLEPRETPLYSFSDLQMQLYYTIYI